jgi:hypothetical protein
MEAKMEAITEAKIETNTKRKTQKSTVLIIFLVLLIILLSLTLILVTIDENAFLPSRQEGTTTLVLSEDLPSEQRARIIGTAIRAYINDENRDDVIATILGKEISAVNFNITAKLLELSGSPDPENDAWDAMKIQAYERNFAIERNIFPTTREIRRFTQETREALESTPEGLEFSKILLEAAGMTPDEYWNDFRLKYESPAHLISIKVAEYRAANGWNDPTAAAIVRRVDEMTANGR